MIFQLGEVCTHGRLPAEYVQSQGEKIIRYSVDTVLLQVVPHLLDLPVQVEIVSVPDRSADLALDSPQVEGLPIGLVSQSLVQFECGPVHQLQDGQLAGELQAVRLHPRPHSYSACIKLYMY